MNIIFTTFIISLAAFLFGAFFLFKKEVPVYYKICVCAVGCFALGTFSSLVFAVCESSSYQLINVSLLGIFGCLCFLVSANIGGDNIHEREEIKIRLKNKDLLAYLAPLVLIISLVISFIPICETRSIAEIVFLIIVFLPILPASFLSLLYLIKPSKKLQLFKFTKLCNLCILLFCISNVISLYLQYVIQIQYAEVLYLINAVLLSALTFDAIRGAKKWKI